MGRSEQLVEVREGTKEPIDVGVVRHVIAEVGHRRRIEGREPDGVDPEPGQVVQTSGDTRKVADAIPVRVGE